MKWGNGKSGLRQSGNLKIQVKLWTKLKSTGIKALKRLGELLCKVALSFKIDAFSTSFIEENQNLHNVLKI